MKIMNEMRLNEDTRCVNGSCLDLRVGSRGCRDGQENRFNPILDLNHAIIQYRTFTFYLRSRFNSELRSLVADILA